MPLGLNLWSYPSFKGNDADCCYAYLKSRPLTVYFDEMITDKRYNFCIKNHLCGR